MNVVTRQTGTARDRRPARRDRTMCTPATLIGRAAQRDALIGTGQAGERGRMVFARGGDTPAIPDRTPTPIQVLILAVLVAATLYSLKTPGLNGTFWCYPAVLFSYFVLPRRAAWVCSVTLAGIAALTMRGAGDASTTVLFLVSLTLVIVTVTVMLNLIDELQRQLAMQAMTDPLTGAFNRRYMDVCLATAIERRNRTGEPASVLLFDVDHFKQINDALGHAAGDKVLKALVALVVGRARRLDVLFRIGGEEFLLLLPGTRYTGALAVAEDLRAVVAGAQLLGARGVSISVGVSELQKGQSMYGWIAEADAALYRAKQNGRNRVAGRKASC